MSASNPAVESRTEVPRTMKQAYHDSYGPPSVVSVRETEVPTPTADRVLVKVRAAAVNRADLDGLYPRWQFTRLFLGLRAPKSPGVGEDMAGTVDAVGRLHAHR
jgi:NADPH:quinone reductase-like Zn-dependent oxidoreductase